MRMVYLASRLESALARWGRGAVALAFGLIAAEWLGWVTGQHYLARTFGNWNPMTPWTAVLLAALGVAILLQSGRPRPRARVWVGRGLAVVAGVLAVLLLAESATSGPFSLAQLWFPDSMNALDPTWAGHYPALTGWAVVLLSAAVAVTRVDRRWARLAWGVGLVAAGALALVAIVAFLFGPLSAVTLKPSSGMSIPTAVCVALLVCAAGVARFDRNPVAWLLTRPDRAASVQLAGAVASIPLVIALFYGLLSLRDVSEKTAWVISVLIVTVLLGVTVFAIAEHERRDRLAGEAQMRSIISNAPNAIVVRNVHNGFEFANQAFADLFGLADPDVIVGGTPVEDLAPQNPELIRKILDAEAAALRGEVAKFEHEFAVGNQRSTLEIQLFPVDDGRGKMQSVGGIGTDVTERARVERRLRERLDFEKFLSQAINDGRLLVYTQPIADARTGQLVEEELLVRLNGPSGELIAPGDFLPQARRFGLMPTIDRFMVARGIELARAGRHVAVNISADSIGDPETIDTIVAQLRQAGDAATRVSFEITETTALATTEIAQRFSDDMSSLGCRLALDDFGTGYGTFTELRGLVLHKLKIDRSFVTGLLGNKRDETIVRMIVDIATEFGLLTTAEGVEDAETRTRLIELGVDQLQGYLIGAPQPATTSSASHTIPQQLFGIQAAGEVTD